MYTFWVQMIAIVFGTMAFGMMLNLRGKWLLWSTVGGSLVWVVYLLLGLVSEYSEVQEFVAAIFLGIYSEILAIKTKAPSTVYLVVGMIPLLPGAALYYTTDYLVNRDYSEAAEWGLTTVITAIALAAGIILSMVGWNVLKFLLPKIRKMKPAKKSAAA